MLRQTILSFFAGIAGGLFSINLVPLVTHAQQPIVRKEIRAERFVVVNPNNAVMATLTYEGSDPATATAALMDRGGHAIWMTPAFGRGTNGRPLSPSANGVYSVGKGVTAPSVLSKVDPEYSEQARNAKYSGSVELSLVVGVDGKATDIRVTKRVGMGLDEKAIEAVQKWQFTPGKKDGVPVPVRALVQVNFRLL